MTERKMKCNECDRDASLRHISGMSGPPSDGKLPLCQVHYADWLFSQSDVDGAVGTGDGTFYVPVQLAPPEDEGRRFDVFVNIPPGSQIGKRLPEGYFGALEYVEKELWEEVTGINYDGSEPVGYVIVDVNAEDEYFQSWGVFAEHSVSGEATPPEQ